jgi:hypothetical protein
MPPVLVPTDTKLCNTGRSKSELPGPSTHPLNLDRCPTAPALATLGTTTLWPDDAVDVGFIVSVNATDEMLVEMPPTMSASEIPATTEPFGSAGKDKVTSLDDGAAAAAGRDVVLLPPPPPQPANNDKPAARISARRTPGS